MYNEVIQVSIHSENREKVPLKNKIPVSLQRIMKLKHDVIFNQYHKQQNYPEENTV